MGIWELYASDPNKRIDNFGAYPDPEGAFPKPDSNILVPNGTSITALDSGIVSGIDTPGSGEQVPYGHAVTVLLATPHNELATHDFYIHLGSLSVQLGQFVNVGDEIGKAGPKSEAGNASGAAPGFGFYPGDWYGRDEAWTRYYQGQFTLDQRLNPVAFLNNIKVTGPKGIPVSPSNASSDPFGVNGLNTFFGQVSQFFSDPTRFFKIVIGFVLFVTGIVIGVQSLKPVQQAEKAIGKVAVAAA